MVYFTDVRIGLHLPQRACSWFCSPSHQPICKARAMAFGHRNALVTGQTAPEVPYPADNLSKRAQSLPTRRAASRLARAATTLSASSDAIIPR